MSILLADSGSTKTDWCLLAPSADGPSALKPQSEFITLGINPFYQSQEEISRELEVHVLPHLGGVQLDAVYFYGAGCTPEKSPLVRSALLSVLPIRPQQATPGDAHPDVCPSQVEVCTDMLAAAHALCGHAPGIACILGTGSNSCFYDGRRLVANVSPLGFILGDEGSGAVLGKLLVGDLLKGQMPQALKEKFLKQYALTPAEIIHRVYRSPFPNRFLASFAPFIAEHRDEPSIHHLLLGAFSAFFCRNVMHYDYLRYPAHFTGSIAWHFQTELREAATAVGVQVGQFLPAPMPGLIRYYSSAHTLNKD